MGNTKSGLGPLNLTRQYGDEAPSKLWACVVVVKELGKCDIQKMLHHVASLGALYEMGL